jgi:hypothetical protein
VKEYNIEQDKLSSLREFIPGHTLVRTNTKHEDYVNSTITSVFGDWTSLFFYFLQSGENEEVLQGDGTTFENYTSTQINMFLTILPKYRG